MTHAGNVEAPVIGAPEDFEMDDGVDEPDGFDSDGYPDDGDESDQDMEDSRPCIGAACCNPDPFHVYRECVTVEMMEAHFADTESVK